MDGYSFTFLKGWPCTSDECYGCKHRKGKKNGYCYNPKREKMDALKSGAILAGEIKCELREAI